MPGIALAVRRSRLGYNYGTLLEALLRAPSELTERALVEARAGPARSRRR